MANRIYDENNGLWYELQGDYYLPCLSITKEEAQPIGLWGQRHLRYIKEYKRVLYSNLLISGKLNEYLADIDKQAEEMFQRLIKQMAEREGINEQLKAEKQILWVQKMNSIKNRVIEVVEEEMIFYLIEKIYLITV